MKNAERIRIWDALRAEGETTLDLRPLMQERLTVDAEVYTDPDALMTAITETAPEQGWITYQSVSRAFCRAEWRLGDESDGLPLRGEWLGKEGSYHLGPARQGWCLTQFSEGTGECYLCDSVTLLATRPDLGAVHYRRLWQDDEMGVPQPWTVQFLGFAGGRQ